MFSTIYNKIFSREPNSKQIEEPIEESIEKQFSQKNKQLQKNRQPKLWIRTQKCAPRHKFAHSHRCVACMSVMHTTLNCPNK